MRISASSARVLVAAAFAAAAAACSLTTDLGGLSGAPDDDVPTLDGSAPDVDGSGPGVSDTGAPEAGADANVKPFVCADHPGAVFCADFEDAPVDLGWGGQSVGTGGAIASGAGHFGLGLVSTVPTHDGAEAVSAALSTGLSLPPKTPFTLAFAMKLGPTHAVGVVDLPSIVLKTPSYFLCSLRVNNTGQVVLFHHGDGTGPAPTINLEEVLLLQPVAEAWVNVEMRVTFPPDEPHISVTFDGASAFDGTFDAGPYAGSTSTEIAAGISDTEGAGKAFELDVDDVLVTTP